MLACTRGFSTANHTIRKHEHAGKAVNKVADAHAQRFELE
jgi:hypothetical protein